jgi:uncharacterized protein
MTFIELPDVSLFLVSVVFIASLLQAVTGIGFGVIAGPVLLVSMGSLAAIQVSILLSFLIALTLSPSTLPKVSKSLLKPLFIGICVGSPLGAVLFSTLSIEALKVLAAIAVGIMSIISTGILARYPLFTNDSRMRRGFAGIISGLLNTTLAMPGPPIAAYTTAIQQDKQTIRATTLVAFLLAYPVALAMQLGTVGLSKEALPMCTALVIPTLVGTLGGQIMGRFIAERVFKWLVTAFLLASVYALLK